MRRAAAARAALLAALGSATAGAQPVASATAAAPAPDRGAWLSEHLAEIRSIDPADEDFTDLEPLAEAIGSARVVQLGEGTHGEGSTFLAKARLIRFLHQRLGFDVLAWEAGFFDCRDFAAALRGNVATSEAADLCLYRIWARSREVEPTLAYLRATQATPRPIESVGFDSRVSTESGRRERFPAFITSFFDRLDRGLICSAERADLTAMSIGLLPADYYAKPGVRNWNRELPRRLIAALDARRAELERIYPPREVDFARQSLVSFLAMDRALPPDSNAGNADGYSRDTAMAENLMWWLEGPLAGRKVMVWAHNYHVQMDFSHPAAFSSRPLGGPTGRFLERELGPDLYTLGFLTHHGFYFYAGGGLGTDVPEPIPAPPPGSLEDLLHASGKPYAFLDLESLPAGHWLREPQTAGAYFYEPQSLDWPRLYDGFFFIDEMKPSTEISPSP